MNDEAQLHDMGLIESLTTPADPRSWLHQAPGAMLWRRAGRDSSRCRALVGLIHGNEPSGLAGVWSALQAEVQPAVNVLAIVASVRAARRAPLFSHRMLPGERDLNRCFGRNDGVSVVSRLAANMLAALREARPEAVVDLHNNSGHNPAYGVGVGISAERIALTALFARRFVASPFRLGSLMEALAPETNIVTIECGRAGDPAADVVAATGAARFVEKTNLFEPPPAEAIELLADPVRVMLRDEIQVAFQSDRRHPADVVLDPDVDRHNFQRLAAGAHIAWAQNASRLPFVALDPDGVDRAAELFELRDGGIFARRALTPIMMTTDAGIARSDCLFYAVQPAEAPEGVRRI
ncbi:MAG: succinylglutamate desuccinylase/aspartoacylase family protein [Leptospirales bacterium]|nr:succinylglutamate desuccinylase/aspartoacylase family protein [Leptospirales bacterium]